MYTKLVQPGKNMIVAPIFFYLKKKVTRRSKQFAQRRKKRTRNVTQMKETSFSPVQIPWWFLSGQTNIPRPCALVLIIIHLMRIIESLPSETVAVHYHTHHECSARANDSPIELIWIRNDQLVIRVQSIKPYSYSWRCDWDVSRTFPIYL